MTRPRTLLAAIVLGILVQPSVGGGVPFEVGEKLTFAVKFGFIKAGIATMEVRDVVDFNGRRCYRLISEARSTMPFSLFFEVRDHVESLMDSAYLYSVRYEKRLKEGSYQKNEVVLFDQDRHLALYPDGVEIPTPDGVQDVLSSLYYVRTLNLRVGESVFIKNHADRKNYPLEVKVLRVETVEVPAGRFECFVVEPILKASGIFQHKGRLTVWLTKNPPHFPVMMKSKIVIGSISAVLIKKVVPGEKGEEDEPR